jgi:hypothetical protein
MFRHGPPNNSKFPAKWEEQDLTTEGPNHPLSTRRDKQHSELVWRVVWTRDFGGRKANDRRRRDLEEAVAERRRVEPAPVRTVEEERFVLNAEGIVNVVKAGEGEDGAVGDRAGVSNVVGGESVSTNDAPNPIGTYDEVESRGEAVLEA